MQNDLPYHPLSTTNYQLPTRHGFTLLEVSIVVGVLSILLTISIVFAFGAISRSALRSAENTLVQALRRAQTMSQQNVRRDNATGSQWGVHICAGPLPLTNECAGGSSSIIIFERDSYGASWNSNDQIFEINPNIAFSGTLYSLMKGDPPPKGIVFTRFIGDPTPSNFFGTIILTMHGESRIVTVNAKGSVER